jgi:hypothetical protein
LEHGANAASSLLSSRHWNVTVEALSLPANRNVAEALADGLGGPPTIEVVGATVSVGNGGPPVQATPEHCSSWLVTGSRGPPSLPVARLPPPSTLTPATVPTAA